MPQIHISQETKDIIDQHQDVIKDVYLTNSLFIDSVVRSRLHAMNYTVGEELILRRLKHLKARKYSNYNQRRIKLLLARHQNRINLAKIKLNKGR